ncbi:penicillin-binding transpeptidase domain-containing protein [uncultured Clostridium sp.]|uniref:penicillin-binding transpeptidase domain-containing protein n=1 Tax=uncultured Clostridium sp. TaxID=59620 RepID=UPI00260C1DDB|nr:penicillin-binding transpeptidase domain-containing protein [uncultured Clostridium sp.]
MIVNKPKKKKKPISRYTIVKFIMIGVFTIIALRVLYLQLYKHEYYKGKANENSTRFIAQDAPRGEILDDKGNILATNREIYNITYTVPSTGEGEFYNTMGQVFNILKEDGETLQDDMMLKLDNGKFYFSYSTTEKQTQEYEKIRFLRDRGMNEVIQKKIYGGQNRELTDVENAKINEELLKVTPEDAFDYLVKTYNIISILNPKPADIGKNSSKEKQAEYTNKMNTYNENVKKYSEMTGAEQLKVLLQKYPLETIRDYVVVKDAMKMQSFKGYRSITIANNIKKETAFTIYQKLNELPGIDVNLQPVRYYPYDNLASSVMGYVSPIDSSLKDEYALRGYDVASDLVGKAGIEKSYEEYLRGSKGGKTVKVNSQGRITQSLFSQEVSQGDNVQLTINKSVQYATQEALKDTIDNIRKNAKDAGKSFPNATRGAALVVDVHTGNILAMASYPDYNPNLFAIPGQLTKEQYQQYFAPDLQSFGEQEAKLSGVTKTVDQLFPKDKNGNREDKYDLYPKPFYNYATLGTMPPGSIFKPLTAIAALEEGVVTPEETVNDTGKFNVHPDVFGKAFGPECWIYPQTGGGHGPVDVEKALQVSCNFFFYEMGYRLYEKALKDSNLQGTDAQIYALNSLAQWAWKFGLGHNPNSNSDPGTGIEIPENTSGQVYNFQSYKDNAIQFSKFNLNSYLEAGDYKGTYKFAPFDFAANSGDSQSLADLKNQLKNLINDRLEKVGTNEKSADYDEFYNQVYPIVLKIMKESPSYQASFENYKKSNPNTTVEAQAKQVALTITQFTIRDVAGEIMSPAQLIYSAIGQGINHFTPMQLAEYTMTIANGGTRYRLHLLDQVTTPNGSVLEKQEPEVVEKLNLKPSTLAAVKEGMRRANDEEGGTAEAVFGSFPIATAGKTGTADYAENQRDFGRAPYATYVSFAPFDNPQIAFVGVIYDAGHGGYTAPVAKAAYEAYFKDQLTQMHYSSTSFTKYVLNAPKDNNPESAEGKAQAQAQEKTKQEQEQVMKDFNNN